MPTQHIKTFTARLALVVGGCVLAAGCGANTTPDAPADVNTPTQSASAPVTAANTPADASTPSSTPSPDTFTPGAPLAETININLGEDGKVSPSGKKIEVVKDTLVTLRVRSTHNDEIHVHGYDVEETIPNGETVTVSFKANKTGSFDIESHNPAKVIVILNVR